MGDKSQGPTANGNPGPGNYEPQNATTKTSPHPNDPQWAFTKNPREMKYGNGNPGPGTYSSPERGRVTKGYMGHKQNEQEKMNVPGPGAYEEESNRFKHQKAPAYSMRAKTGIDSKKNVPGPGQYDPDNEKVAWKSYSGKMTTKAARDQLGRFGTPGAGTYDPANGTFERKQGKFSKGPREWLAGNGNPGPGAYEDNGPLGNEKKKGYSYGKQPRDGALGSGTPGPGTYELNNSSMGGPAWKQGKQARDWLKTSGNPGPGNYEGDTHAFNRTHGKINPTGKDASGYNYPGPGTYDGDFHVGKSTDPKFSFGKDVNRQTDLGVPGPGAYDGNGVPTKQSIAMDKRDKGLNYGNGNPGPGTYDGKGDVKWSHDAKYSFGREARDKEKERLKVGPADYKIPHSIPDVAGYNYPTMHNRKIQFEW